VVAPLTAVTRTVARYRSTGAAMVNPFEEGLK
jgi:hypothetical protein